MRLHKLSDINSFKTIRTGRKDNKERERGIERKARKTKTEFGILMYSRWFLHTIGGRMDRCNKWEKEREENAQSDCKLRPKTPGDLKQMIKKGEGIWKGKVRDKGSN